MIYQIANIKDEIITFKESAKYLIENNITTSRRMWYIRGCIVWN